MPVTHAHRCRRLAAVAAVAAVAATAAHAQRATSGSLGERVVHESWTRELPRTAVRGILQTRDGYLRLATDGGLVRFDGNKFAVTRVPTPAPLPDSLPDDYLSVLLEARDGTLWIGTDGAGIAMYRDGRYRTFDTDQGLPDHAIHALVESRDGKIWVGTTSGIGRWTGGRFERLTAFPPTNVNALVEDTDGAIWIATENGVDRFVGGRVERFELPALGTPRVPALLRSRDGSIWIGTAQGLAVAKRRADGRYTVARLYTVRDGLRSNYITSIAERAPGELWVGTKGGGVARLETDERFRSFGTSEGLADNNVNVIASDHEGNVWIGTGDGLSRLREPSLSNWRGDGFWPTSLIWSADALADGSLWVGSGSEGAIRIAPDGTTRLFTMADGLPSNVVYTSYRRPDGSIWMGTRQGIAQLHGTRFVDHTATLGLQRVGIRAILQDSRGRFWVGTDSALTVGTGGVQTIVPSRTGSRGGRIYGVVEDRARQIWVAGGGPLTRIQRDTLVPFVSGNGRSLPQAMDLLPDTAGLWVGDYIRGLSLIRHDSLFTLPLRVGVFSEILRVVDDGRGALWLTSSSGLQRVWKSDVLAFFADSSARVRVRQFNKVDGLRSHDFAKAGGSSGTRGRDGRLWLPTTGGLAVVDPVAVPLDTIIPQVFVERVIADGVVLRATDPVVLPRGTHNVRIEFTTTMLAAPLRARLWYRLEGVDADWRRADPQDRLVDYRDLPSGELRFEVRAENADGIASVTPAQVVLVARTAWSATLWVWVLGVSAIVGLVLRFLRWRIGALRERAAMLRGLVARFRATLYSINEGLITTNASGVVSAMNPRAEALTGWQERDAVGRPLAVVYQLVVRPAVHVARHSGDESTAPAAPAAAAAPAAPAAPALTVLVSRDGTERPIAESRAEITDEVGEAHGGVIVFRDETEQRARQQYETESRKMESLGRLAGGIAHDFNNLLGIINGAAQMASTCVEPEHPVTEDLLQVQQAAERAAELTRQLMAFSRRRTVAPQQIDVTEAVRQLQQMLGRLLGRGIALDVRGLDEPLFAQLVPGQIEQVVMNLTINGRDAMPTGGRIAIKIAPATLRSSHPVSTGVLAPGDYVSIAVRDFGSGMDDVTCAQIFEPFFTTKQAGHGTGLGLATVHRIVRDHAGAIDVRSALGDGTTFTVYIPRAAA